MLRRERWVWENPEILKSIDRGMGFMICDDCVKKDVCRYTEDMAVFMNTLVYPATLVNMTCKHKRILYPDEWISDPYSHTESADYTPRR